MVVSANVGNIEEQGKFGIPFLMFNSAVLQQVHLYLESNGLDDFLGHQDFRAPLVCSITSTPGDIWIQPNTACVCSNRGDCRFFGC